MSNPSSIHSIHSKESVTNANCSSFELLQSSSNSSYSTACKQRLEDFQTTTPQIDGFKHTITWPHASSISFVHGPGAIGPYNVYHPFATPARSHPESNNLSHWSGSASTKPWLPLLLPGDSSQVCTRSGARCRNLPVPRPSTAPIYDLVTQYRGLRLCRLCPSVPYLLGPWTMVERLQAVLEHGFADIETLVQAGGERSVAKALYNSLDRALLYMFVSLEMPLEERIARGNWTTQGLAVSGSTLRLYVDRRPLPPQPIDVSLNDFVQMAEQWKQRPNPALTYGDHPAAKNAWSEVAAKLQAKHISIEKIDTNLYRNLTVECDATQLDEKIDQLKEWHDNGELEARFAERKSKSAQQAAIVSEANESVSDSSALFSKRYTHKHPFGITAAALKFEQAMEQEQLSNLSNFSTKTEDAISQTSSAKFAWLQIIRRRRYAFTQTVIILILLLGILIPLVWSSRSQKSDWTHSS